MKYFAGIDGGQSGTSAVIGDESGKILGRGAAGPADEVGEGAQSTRMRDALANALADASVHAGLPAQTRFESIVAAVSGYEGRVYGAAPVLPGETVSLVHDSQAAHAGALNGEPGTVVIAGTGSVAYAVDARGAGTLTGGWGYVFGDEGSAFALARVAVSDAMHDADAGAPNALGALALTHFGVASLHELARAFYANEITRSAFAGFAVAVIAAAERGDGNAARHVREAADALVALAMRALVRAGLPADAKVAFTGGLTAGATIRGLIAQRMRAQLPRAVHVAPAHDSAAGALILAYRAAGVKAQIA